jgi:hypothetical protein
MPNAKVLPWLLEDDQPSVRYYALKELLDGPAGDSDARQAFADIGKRGWARDILAKQTPHGSWESANSLYRPKYIATNWMALILSDLGLTRENPRIAKAAALLFDKWLREDGSDNIFKDEVCIVGNTARMLARFGYADDPRVMKLFDRLVNDQKDDGGWHCWESARGTLDCWEGLAAFAELPGSKRSRRIKRSIERGAEFYLERKLLVEEGPKYRPWFRLHYPVHYYYDVLVGLDVVTKLGYGADSRLETALKILNDKRRKDGRWVLDRIHPDPPSYAWVKGNLKSKVTPFALEEAGKPSKWVTLTAMRVLKRVEDSAP